MNKHGGNVHQLLANWQFQTKDNYSSKNKYSKVNGMELIFIDL